MLKWNQNAILSLRRSTWEPKKEPSILPFNLMTSTLLNLSVAVFCIGRKMCVGGRGVGVKEKSHVCTCFLQMPAAPAPLPSSAQTPWRWRWVTFVPRSPWAWLGLTWTLNLVCGEVQGSEGLGGGKILRSALNPSLELSPAVKRRGGVWVCVLGWGRVALEVHGWMDRKGSGGGGWLGRHQLWEGWRPSWRAPGQHGETICGKCPIWERGRCAAGFRFITKSIASWEQRGEWLEWVVI